MPSAKTNIAECIFLLVLTINSDKFITTCDKTDNVWRKAGRLTGLLLHNCIQLSSDRPQEQFLLILQRCLKRRSLIILDRSLGGDVIKLANGIELVRYRNDTNLNRRDMKMDEISEVSWKKLFLKRIAQLLHTHVLKIHLRDNADLQNFEGRGRRKRKGDMMMMLLMFGIAAVVLIMVPMGFQFLAVLGGKALLLAKMALILTAIQGLKKIATSNLHYGLYTAPPEQHHHHGWHFDRQWPHYDSESHDTGPYPYQISDQQADLAHPLHPRIDSFKDLM